MKYLGVKFNQKPLSVKTEFSYFSPTTKRRIFFHHKKRSRKKINIAPIYIYRGVHTMKMYLLLIYFEKQEHHCEQLTG